MKEKDESAAGSMQRLQQIGGRVQEHFAENKRVLTFAEYMGLVETQPRRHLRNSAQYLLDLFDFGLPAHGADGITAA